MKTKTTTTIKQHTKLKAIKREINDAYESAQEFIASAKDKSRQALKEAMVCGRKLTEAKAIVGHGGWLRWLKENCKAISDQTARKYMKLSNSNLSLNHPATDVGLQQAYVLLGFVGKETESPGETSGATHTNGSTMKTKTPSSTPALTLAESASAKAKAVATAPAISKADVLSRTRYLTKELLQDVTDKHNSGAVSIADLQAAALTPLAALFASLKPKKK